MKRAVAWVAATATLILTVISLILVPALFRLDVPPGVSAIYAELFGGDDLTARLSGIALGITFASFTVLGLVILHRSPGNVMGWILMAIGSNLAVVFAIGVYSIYGLYGSAGRLPWAEEAVWVGQWAWTPGWSLIVVFLLLFPTGKPVSRRWRRALYWTGALTIVELAAYFFGPDPSTGGLPVHRLVVIPEADPALYALGRAADILAALTFTIALASLVVRYRRGGALERQQVKWIAFATGVFSLALVPVMAGAILWDTATTYAISLVPLTLSLVALPIAAGIAIMRYRLFDVDILINRTLVYGSLSAALGASYVAFVLLFQAALRPFTAGSELAVAGSTLLTLALVQPLRWRIQEVVDRRFYRSRYDAARTLDDLARRLRDEVDLDAVRSDVLDVVGATVRPVHAAVWLRQERT